jgi:hypothetical protein
VARFVERSERDWFSSLWKLAVFVGMLMFCLVYIYPHRGLAWTIVLVIASLWTYLALVSRDRGYVCAKCHKPFQVPTAVNFFTTSNVGKKPDGTYYSYKTLTCPNCGARTKARLVKRVGAREAKGSGRMLK